MRIVHTSDWHAGRIWKGRDRLDELQNVLENLGDFITQDHTDLLLVSGDIFDNGAPAATAERAVFRFFRRVGDAGTKTVVIAGNHDSAARLEAWGTLAELVGVHAVARPSRVDQGGIVTLEGRSGDRAIVAAIPWAPVRDIVSALELAENETGARQRYADWMKRIAEYLSSAFQADAINLMIAHTHLEGALFGGSERKVHLGDDWAAAAQSLPATAHYVALGHIHKPQRIQAAPSPTCYAGSPLQLDFGEAGEEKSFVVIDARPRQPVEIQRVPYRGGTPLAQIRSTLGDLERDAERLRNHGWLRVVIPLSAPDPDISGKVRRLLPNAVAVDVEASELEHESLQVDRAGLTPAQLFSTYFRNEHGFRSHRQCSRNFQESEA
jgi:DNA repair protein SbcD/Mre11